MVRNEKKVRFIDNVFPYFLMLISILIIGYIAFISDFTANYLIEEMPQHNHKSKEIVIRWSPWLRIGELELLREKAVEFNEMHDSIRVEMLPLSKEHYEREILVDMMTGRAPDVFYSSEEFLQLLSRDDKVVDLTEYFINWEQSESFLPELIQIGSRNGRLFGIPIEMDSLIVYFNEDIFNQKGLHTPLELYAQGEWNWDALEEISLNISLTGAEHERYGLVLQNWWATNYSFIYQNGGVVFDKKGEVVINSKRVRETVRFLRNMIEDGALLFMETTQEGGTYADLFRQQRAGMIISGGSLSSDFKNSIINFDWGIVPLPEGRFGHKGSSRFVSFICINNESSYKEHAWEFIRFLASSDAFKKQMYAGSRFISPLKILLPEFADIFEDSIYTRYTRHIPMQHLLWPEVGRSINQGFVRIWSGENENVELYLGQLAAEANVMLRRIRAKEAKYVNQRY